MTNKAQVQALAAANSSLASSLQAEWRKIEARTIDEAEAIRPKLKVFEVHHRVEKAREDFFTAVLASLPVL